VDVPHAVIKQQPTTKRLYARLDGLGNVLALTDTSGSIRTSYGYDDWGKLTSSSDQESFNGTDRARWKGALWLGPEVDLYYLRARWYEPHSGRFLSEDPIGLEGGINAVLFAGNDPVNGADPSGLTNHWVDLPGETVVGICDWRCRMARATEDWARFWDYFSRNRDTPRPGFRVPPRPGGGGRSGYEPPFEHVNLGDRDVGAQPVTLAEGKLVVVVFTYWGDAFQGCPDNVQASFTSSRDVNRPGGGTYSVVESASFKLRGGRDMWWARGAGGARWYSGIYYEEHTSPYDYYELDGVVAGLATCGRTGEGYFAGFGTSVP
jgi:RHS repeat-associated protein